MQGDRQNVGIRGGLEDLDAEASTRVDDDLARLKRAPATQPGDQIGQHRIGHGEDDELGAREDLVGRIDGNPGQQRAGPGHGGVTQSAGRDDPMTCRVQRSADHRADSPRRDDPDVKTCRSL